VFLEVLDDGPEPHRGSARSHPHTG
jgi:hypothetical protein